MSAIFGYVGARDEAELERMSHALAGAFDRPGSTTVVNGAGLGYRRWSRDRPGAGVMYARDGDIHFTASARIDNRQALRADLSGDGDLELLFAAYRQWGIAGLTRIAGSFAFAAWHGDTRRLVLARSAIVAPPLHYHDGDSFSFATMPRGLFALPEVRRAIDRRVLAMNLVRLSGPDAVTLYQGIMRVPTGAALIRTGHAPPSIERWWTGNPGPAQASSAADHAVALRALLTEVVEAQLPEAGPTAIQLSGGLDSASIAALAATARPERRLIGFTHVPGPIDARQLAPGWYSDETDLVRDIARRYDNLDCQRLPVENDYFLDTSAMQAMHQLERHFSNIGNLGWLRASLEGARREGAAVMLTGVQGNFTASRPGGAALPVALTERRWHDAARSFAPRAALSVGLMSLPDSLRRQIMTLRGKGFSAADRPWRSASVIRPEFADAQHIDDLGQEWLETYRPLPRIDERPALAHALRRQDVGLIDHMFASLHGVEIRNPLTDVRVADFCLSAPNHFFHVDGVPRSLIRTAMHDLLPASVRDNRQRGSQAADMPQRIRDHLPLVLADLDRLARSELAQETLDLTRLRAIAEALPDPTDPKARPRFALLSFGLTIGRFLCQLESEGVR